MDDSKCYKKFKEIIKSNGENKYLGWKKWLEGELIGYNREGILNLLRYCEIKQEVMKNADEPKALAVFIPVSSVFITFIAVIISLVIAVYDNLLFEQSELRELTGIEKYVTMVNDTLTTELGEMLNVTKMAVFIIGVILVAYCIDYFRQKDRAKRQTYYLEMTRVLKDILEKKEEDEAQVQK